MNPDCCFTRENNWFRYRAAAIIVEDDSVLFVTNEKDDRFADRGAVGVGYVFVGIRRRRAGDLQRPFGRDHLCPRQRLFPHRSV